MSMNNPKQTGRYLALVFEWAGTHRDKPKEPQWEIKTFTRKTTYDGSSQRTEERWQREEYRYDTGGYENFELVSWQELPPVTITP